MKTFVCFVLALGLIFAVSAHHVLAGNTPGEAEAMVKKAVDSFKANGKEKTIAAINDPKGEFMKGELYAFVFDFDIICLAHPANPKLVGKNMADLKDAEGKSFMKAMATMAKAGGGWVDYKWTNPETKKIQDKSSYVTSIPGENLFVGCGIYK
ncbi:MAG: cache domain-containing protein [Syntrophobacteraceae bacterium]